MSDSGFDFIESQLHALNEEIKDIEDEKEFLLSILHVTKYISGVNPPINKDLDVINDYITRKFSEAEDKIKSYEKLRDIWMEKE